ncbi:hypothetical protein KDD93_01930 [Campylobacter sp. faydin G-24]|uniref:Uncharacterized protein n=1 Tax=Campylobacter anatolicus TaxID=2829105 RepID=A0ABS5HGD4_9BACT|nr:hypothetical protein [Campylobacter anatolicus]MBR8463330.1 hypothetical protein [Campylobacter anatolicus]
MCRARDLIRRNAVLTTNRIISCTENNISLRFDCNRNEFHKIHLDSPAYSDILQDAQRCDYIILKDNLEIGVFVELKGNDIEKAMNQILTTKNNFGDGISIFYAAIVYRSKPSFNATAQNLKERYNREFDEIFISSSGLNLKYSNNKVIKS